MLAEDLPDKTIQMSRESQQKFGVDGSQGRVDLAKARVRRVPRRGPNRPLPPSLANLATAFERKFDHVGHCGRAKKETQHVDNARQTNVRESEG